MTSIGLESSNENCLSAKLAINEKYFRLERQSFQEANFSNELFGT
jgi:hypothetical protein